MRSLMIGAMVLVMAGCVTPVKEESGKYIKAVQAANRDEWGTNQSFGRLQRCDGPEKEPLLFFRDKDLKNCKFLTKAEQDEWVQASSPGAAPQVLTGAAVGMGIGLSGGATAAAGASASATNTAIQTVTGGKHHRR